MRRCLAHPHVIEPEPDGARPELRAEPCGTWCGEHGQELLSRELRTLD